MNTNYTFSHCIGTNTQGGKHAQNITQNHQSRTIGVSIYGQLRSGPPQVSISRRRGTAEVGKAAAGQICFGRTVSGCREKVG